jgi:uncharacterized Zn finger protein (UPF0148 family)
VKAYCPTCRDEYVVDENPPYAVIHTVEDPPRHLHPETREVVEHA